jgi:hypothetical protein
MHNYTLDTLIRLYKLKVRAAVVYAAHVWAYKIADQAEAIQAWFFKRMLGLERPASNTHLRLEIGLTTLHTHIMSNTLKFWQRILLLEENRLPKIIARELLRQEVSGQLQCNNWARYFQSILANTAASAIQQDPFSEDFIVEMPEIIEKLWLLDAERSTKIIMDRANCPFIAAQYLPPYPSHCWSSGLAASEKAFWLQLRLNKYRLSIGNSTMLINTEECKLCNMNVSMSIYHIMFECTALYHVRDESIESLRILPIYLFELFPYVIDCTQFIVVYNFLKIVIKDFYKKL